MTFLTACLHGLRTPRGRRELDRFLKFSVVGTWGFIVDFSVLNFLMFVAHFPAWLANTCSFSIAVLNTFTFNRLWTVPESRQRLVSRQLAQFFTVSLIGYAINEIVFLSSHALVWRYLLPATFAWNLAKATASGVGLFWNFSVNRLWTWRGL